MSSLHLKLQGGKGVIIVLSVPLLLITVAYILISTIKLIVYLHHRFFSLEDSNLYCEKLILHGNDSELPIFCSFMENIEFQRGGGSL